MKRIAYDGTGWLVGDTMGDLLLDYAVVLARNTRADTVNVVAIDEQGDERIVSLLLGPATMMSSEEYVGTTPEPENTEAEKHLRTLIEGSEIVPTSRDNYPSSTYMDDF